MSVIAQLVINNILDNRPLHIEIYMDHFTAFAVQKKLNFTVNRFNFSSGLENST